MGEWWQEATTSTLNWYRSWPSRTPPKRAFVHDSLPRLVMSDCDYRTAMDWPAESICLLEWDVALAKRWRDRFAEAAEQRPDEVLVAPYDLNFGNAVRQVHRYWHGQPIIEGHNADLFGLGCVYLPEAIVAAFLMTDLPFTDDAFSRWHYMTHGPVRVTWDIHPQHLHGD